MKGLRNAARELSDRLHFLHLKQRLARFFQRPARLNTLGNVPRDPGEAGERAFLVTDGVDHDVRPEPPAVFPDSPALGFEASFRCCDGQSMPEQEPG